MRRLRFFEENGLVEVTARTIHGRFILKPAPNVNEIIVGVLGRAQARSGLEIIYVVFMSNHFHMICRPNSPRQLAQFMNFAGSNIARELGRIYGWRERFWSRRYQAIPISEEPEAQLARLRYAMAHGCKEGFVLTPADWPGVHCVRELLSGEPLTGTWFDRTKEYRARCRGIAVGEREFASKEILILTPLPCWADLPRQVVCERVAEMIAEIETEARNRATERGRPVVGARRVLRQNPHDLPAKSKRSPAPAIHAASRAVRRAFQYTYRLFLNSYRDAAEELRAGNRLARFPMRCFPPALQGDWAPS